jgi:MoaD family protein
MKVKVKTFANLRDVVGKPEIEHEIQDGATLGYLLDDLCRTYGKSFEHQIKDRKTGVIVPFLMLVNDKTCRSVADLSTPLGAGDTVTIMLPFDGG